MPENLAKSYTILLTHQPEDSFEAQAIENAKGALIVINRTRKMGLPKSGCVASSMAFTHGLSTIERLQVSPIIEDVNEIKLYALQLGGSIYELPSLSPVYLRELAETFSKGWLITLDSDEMIRGTRHLSGHMFGFIKSPKGFHVWDTGKQAAERNNTVVILDEPLQILHARILRYHRARIENPIVFIGFTD